jgi:peptidoglycan/xylan/chitin deacetylase (PgdA/CDA1 family)
VPGRQREYYIGDRARRRSGRRLFLAVALVAVVAVAAGAVAMSRNYFPAFGFAGQSMATATFAPLPSTAASDASSSLSPVTTPFASPSATSQVPSTPLPSVPPVADAPLPCRPPANAQLATVISHGDFKKNVVALTFDDGTNPENTKQILKTLVREKVNATFFPTGVALERFPDVWKAVDQDNFPIANHTYAHGALKGKCYEPQRKELARAAGVFTTIKIAEQPYMRPPYELWDETTEAAASAAGLKNVILWNVDTGDWNGASAATIRRIASSGGKGSIILMHTFPEATAVALPGIIKSFKARGFEFVTIGQLLGIDGPVPYPSPTKG